MSTFDVFIVIVYQMLFILITYGLALMVNKRLLMDVRSQEEKFSMAFHSSPDSLMLTRLTDGKIFEVNAGFEKMSGYTTAEVLGKTTSDLGIWAREDDREFFVGELSGIGRVDGMEFQFRKKSGETVTGIVSANIFVFNDQPAILAIIRDITERKKAEEELRERVETLNAITGSAHDAIIIIDGKGIIAFWNRAADRILGYAGEEAVGKNLHELIAPERYWDAHKSAFPHFQKTGEGAAVGTTLELYAIRKDRQEIPVELSLSSVRIKGEWAAVGIIRDISGRKRMEKALQDTQAETLRLLDEASQSHRILLSVAEDQMRVEEELKRHRDHLEEMVKERTAELEKAKVKAEAANRAKSVFIVEHVPRNTHAHERDPRFFAINDARSTAPARTDRASGNDQSERRESSLAHQQHPRNIEDRSGTYDGRPVDVPSARPAE